jgi:sugar/nucleoside kinase (ribokinase family)
VTIRRLVGLGSVVVDLVLHVPRLPQPGGDVLASSSGTRVGGGLNALAAASAAGLPVAYGGGHGTGPFGDLVRTAMAEHRVSLLLSPTAGSDTGYTVVLVDGTGERTFATSVGAEGRLTAAQLDMVDPAPGDAVYVSGYDLVYPHAPLVADRVTGLDAGTLVVFDPGPLVDDIAPELLTAVLEHASWLSLNAREAATLTGTADPSAAAGLLLARQPGLAGVVVRVGPGGAVITTPGRCPVHVPGVPVARVVDTNGAGDVHVGAFVAALAAGLDPVGATVRANGAAAASVSRGGPATMKP